MSGSFYSIGFFGIPNYGDELLCVSIRKGLSVLVPGATVYTSTADPNISSSYSGIEREYLIPGLAPSRRYLRHWIRHLSILRKSDLTLIGGGGLIADYYTWASIVRYALDPIIGLAMGRKYVFVGIGARPIRRRWLRPLVRFFCRNASAVYARDDDAAEALRGNGCRDILVGPDLSVLSYPPVDFLETQEYALVNVREKPFIDPRRIQDLCSALSGKFPEIVLLSAEMPDTTYYRQLVSSWPKDLQERIRILEPKTLEEGHRTIGQARLVIAERLHVNVAAVQMQRPLGCICYERKVSEFLEMLGCDAPRADLNSVDGRLVVLAMEADSTVPDSRLGDTRREAECVLSEVLTQARQAGKPRLWVRFQAIFWATVLLGLCIVWSLASLAKSLVDRKDRS
ncbi:MAG: polysaccharide pyruvyl transferase family protein [Phycisphaerae bacterium]